MKDGKLKTKIGDIEKEFGSCKGVSLTTPRNRKK